MGALYNYVRLIDLDSRISGSPYGGADIDAVGAISTITEVPEPSTLFLLVTGVAGLFVFNRKRIQFRN